MSAVLAVFGTAVQGIADPELHELLATMAYRGNEEVALWRSPAVALATARDRWELDPGFAGPTLIASRGPYHAICDATLYYKEDLRSRLRGVGVEIDSDAAADLIVAAYAAFGADCVEYLEGDFAFCVWDERERTLFCARDPFGTRSLYHMEWEGIRCVASTPHPLVRLQGDRAAFDSTGVLRAVLGQTGAGTSTAWRHIDQLPAAYTLIMTPTRVAISRYWVVRGDDHWGSLATPDAARELAHLLESVSRERQHRMGNALAMSGGQDSTAILASLDHGDLADRGPIHILSLKFPEGDSGNEDWYVNRVADRFGLPVHWVDTAEIPLFSDIESRARLRSNPLRHTYEGQNRALASAAREHGVRVLINGHGGDNLFAVTDWKMADLLRQGRWLELRRYASARGYRGVRSLLIPCLRPAVPFWFYDLAELIRGRPICSRPFERLIPPWVTADDDRLREIRKADRSDYSASILRHQRTILAQRRAWALMHSSFHYICQALFDMTRDEGVELRMPFFDRRLVRFAFSRPEEDLNQPWQSKVILLRAMEGRLPKREWKILPGGMRPGTTIDYGNARFKAEVPELAESGLRSTWISEELEIVDRRLFLEHLAGRSGNFGTVMDCLFTVSTEMWLQNQ